jgi:hypothetical protein
MSSMNDSELLEYSKEHLCYEIGMMWVASRVCGFAKSVLLSDPLQSIAVESFALHVRNLIDFIYPTQNRTDDVIAKHFCAGGRLPSGLTTISPALKGIREQVHKQISHLTSLRPYHGDPKKRWHWLDIMRELMPRLREFITAASPDKLHPSVPELVEHIADELSRFPATSSD